MSLFRCLRDEDEQVDAAQEPVDVMPLQADAPALRGHKAVFERVRNAHACSQADDTGRAFEGMRGAHTGLELLGGFRIALQREKPGRQDLGLAFGVEPEQLDHRDVFQVDAHAKLRFRAMNRSSSFRIPTERSRQGRIFLVNVDADFPTVAGTSCACCGWNW